MKGGSCTVNSIQETTDRISFSYSECTKDTDCPNGGLNYDCKEKCCVCEAGVFACEGRLNKNILIQYPTIWSSNIVLQIVSSISLSNWDEVKYFKIPAEVQISEVFWS